MAQRGIPMEKVPEDAEPISEEQFERLPEYVVNLMAESLAGKLNVTTRGELEELSQRYFQPRVEELEEANVQILAGKRAIDLVSNSPLDAGMTMDEHEV